MSVKAMYQKHENPTTSCLHISGRRRIQTKYGNGVEMVAEYDGKTDELISKKWRQPTQLGQGKWEFEIGDSNEQQAVVTNTTSNGGSGGGGGGMMLMGVSSINPTFHSRDFKEHWEFKIRNLPYPKDVYQVTIDTEKQEIVLRTTNKKYYKRWSIPSLHRLNIPLDGNDLDFDHSKTTLTIQYDKPEAVLELEKQERIDRFKMSTDGSSGGGQQKVGGGNENPECAQS